MQLTYSQCKQIASNGDLRDTVESLQDQPDWLCHPVTYHNSENGDTRSVMEPANLDLSDIQAIQQGGCASGAYMPAVTYWQASKTMAEHGDDVLEYIVDQWGELPTPDNDLSWSGIAVLYLSTAVEIWCAQFDLDGVDWD